MKDGREDGKMEGSEGGSSDLATHSARELVHQNASRRWSGFAAQGTEEQGDRTSAVPRTMPNCSAPTGQNFVAHNRRGQTESCVERDGSGARAPEGFLVVCGSRRAQRTTRTTAQLQRLFLLWGPTQQTRLH
jgi:hypothetical protein